MFRALLTTFLWLPLACCVSGDVGNHSASAHSPLVPQDVPSDTVITLMRADCYGGCPTYTLSINAEGKVLYNGAQMLSRRAKPKVVSARKS
jgi:hypothetical protein